MANKFLSSTSSSDDIFKNPAETRAKLGLIYGTTLLNFDTTLNNLANLVDNTTSGGQLMKLIGNDGFSLINVSAAGEAALNSAETLLTTSNLTFTPTSTDVLQNKTISGANNTITNLDNANIANGAGYITASSTDTLTNKSISYSQITGEPTNLLTTNTAQDITAEKIIDQANSGELGFKLNSAQFGQNVNTYLKVQGHANTTTSDKEFILPSLNISSNSDILCGLSSTQTLTNKTISGSSNSITGLGISNITNLQTELDAKQDTLTAGTNITISGTTISAGGGSNWTNLIGGDIYKLGGDVGIGTSSPKTALQIGAEGTSDAVGSWGSYNIEAGSLSIINNNVSSGTDTKTVIDMARYGKDSYANGARGQIKIGRYANASSGSPYSAKTRMDFDLLDLDSSSSLNTVMSLRANGNVGIGTTSPETLLTLGNSNGTNGTRDLLRFSTLRLPNAFTISNDDYNDEAKLEFFHTNTTNIVHTSILTMKMDALGNGHVGIGTTSPNCALEVDRTSSVYIPSGRAYWYNGEQGHSAVNRALAIHAHGAVWSDNSTGFIATSDRRIKKNIVDVPDNLALEMVRNIPCRYYEYKDNLYSGTEKTIGFIAQEVKEILPMAISIQTSIIPNEMRKLENVSWEQIENTYKLITDLQDDVSGVKYRFYVSNDVSGNDEIKKEIIGNSDNSFTFDSSYNNVFIYGKEVDDFHTLDKQKIFALHHSAIQELDRLVQDLRTKDEKIVELKHEVAELQKEMYYLQEQDKIKFDDLESRLKNLENTG